MNKPTKKNTDIGEVKPREIVEEMKDSYIDYAMSVIVSRALPDVRDGLKPVHRRILHAMNEMGLGHSAKFRKSATVVGECFVKDTLILTKRGLLPIQDVLIGDEVYTQNGLNKISQLYEIPEKPLLKMTLDNGISNIITLSQKFKVLTSDWKFEWKEAKDLNNNDYLVAKADFPEIKNRVKLRQINENQPKFLNENIGYFLGVYVSEGSISNDYSKKKYLRISISNGSINTIERLASILYDEFGYMPTIEKKKNYFEKKFKNYYTIRINRKIINDFFVENFDIKGRKASNKEIPQQIFISPKSVIFSFISGLIDGDGSINSEKNCIHYGSVSEKLIKQLQILLMHQGLFSSKYVDSLINKQHYIGLRKIKSNYPFHYLEVRGEMAVNLAKKVSIENSKRKERIFNLVQKCITGHKRKGSYKYDIIPYAGNMLFSELSRNHLGAGWYRDLEGNKFRDGIKYPDGTKIRYSHDLQEKPLRKTQVLDWGIGNKLEKIGSPLFDFLEDVIKNKIYFLKVSSIENVAPEKTYDFEVENDHEFIANGIVSHNCLGKFHPHGDMAVYDAAVRMAQDFSLRYPLITGQGNFGSLDSDPPAASRYTEMKLSQIGEETLKDIERDTVDFMDNYDGTRKEPTVLPSPLPQLLLNGSFGIAVGMATSIPPHNLSELINATIHLIDHPKTETADLFQWVQGPDFPTGGIIYDQKEIISAYSLGKGSIIMRGKADVVEAPKGTPGEGWQIIITEIPYQVQKSELVSQMADLVNEKKIEGIRDIKDLSDREGMRILIDIKKGYQPQRILNQLYKFTNLQKVFYLNMLALVDGIQPKILSLAEVLNYFILHRRDVVVRRTKFDLEKAKDRTHILEGLTIALRKIDAVISTIKKSKDREDAKNNLIKKFKLTEKQAIAILEMKLQTLAGLERKKIEDELKEMLAKIKELAAILKSPEKLKNLLKKEFQELKEKYGDQRRTKVVKQKLGEITEIDLVPLEETIVTLTTGGYIKRINPTTYKIQKRGGKGIMGMKTLQDDIVEHFVSASTHDNLFFFTDSGKVFQTQAYEIPEGTRVARGRGLLNFLEISTEEKVLGLLPIKKEEAGKVKYLVMVTKNGKIKKTALEEYKNVRRSGIIAIRLTKGDLLKKVVKTSGEDDLIITTKRGIAIRFHEKGIRAMGRLASGVRGIRIKKGDEVVGMDVIESSKFKVQNAKLGKQYLLVVMENGYGKRTDISQYRVQGRAGAGIKTAKITSKTGEIVISRILSGDEEDLIVISQKGQVIRTFVNSISILGRATQGVRIMRLDPGDKVASGTCI